MQIFSHHRLLLSSGLGDDDLMNCNFYSDFDLRALELVREFLWNELKFQSKFEAEAKSFLERCSADHEIYQDVVHLLEYLHTIQAALVRRLGDVTAELTTQLENQVPEQAHGGLTAA